MKLVVLVILFGIGCWLMLGMALTGYVFGADDSNRPQGGKAEDVTATEDLGREHGVVERVLLIYENMIWRIDNKKDVPIEALGQTAKLIKRFINDYHERLEEEYIFPKFKAASREVETVDTLKKQHERGRELTKTISNLAVPQPLAGGHDADKQKLTTAMQEFIRMYRPHLAREDTVIFEQFRQVVSPAEFDELGDKFEKREHELFGENGFEKIVGQVAEIEKRLGIYDLNQFTPK